MSNVHPHFHTTTIMLAYHFKCKAYCPCATFCVPLNADIAIHGCVCSDVETKLKQHRSQIIPFVP